MITTFAEDFQNGVLAIYSGTQPASADDSETGELLCLITKDGGGFTAGSPDNGLNFTRTEQAGTVSKAEGEEWMGTAVANGTAGWFRFYDNNYTTGASETAKRFDGSIGTSTDAEMQITNPALTKGGKIVIEAFPVTLPMTDGV
ncbi:MAG: hypothetical protein J6S60_09755 [Oscillospiraceae bacterium]|nr:hypothetical protein [Oscillospiraceae bacterium]